MAVPVISLQTQALSPTHQHFGLVENQINSFRSLFSSHFLSFSVFSFFFFPLQKIFDFKHRFQRFQSLTPLSSVHSLQHYPYLIPIFSRLNSTPFSPQSNPISLSKNQNPNPNSPPPNSPPPDGSGFWLRFEVQNPAHLDFEQTVFKNRALIHVEITQLRIGGFLCFEDLGTFSC